MTETDYEIRIEKKHHKDYQADYYRVLIFNKRGKFITRSADMFYTIELAEKAGQEIVEQLVHEINFPKKIWIANDFKVYKKIAIMVLSAILFGGLMVFLFNETGILITITIYILAIPFIIIFTQRKQVVAFRSYLYDDGLYLITFINQNASEANAMYSSGFEGRALKHSLEGLSENSNYLNRIKEISDIDELPNRPIVWKFTKVLDIIKKNDNAYKIRAEYVVQKSGKAKKITFTLKNRYSDFNGLLYVFNHIREKSL